MFGAITGSIGSRAMRGEAVGEVVLGAEHHARADDRRVGEGVAHRALAKPLGAAIVRRRVGIGADRADLDEGRRPGVARRGGGMARAGDVDGVQIALERSRPG